jgi:hypothetical protein
MPLDKIVVLILALAFFGGILFVYWKARQEEKEGGPELSLPNADKPEKDLSSKSQEKQQKISKR